MVLTSFGRVMRLTERAARNAPDARRADRRARRAEHRRPRRARRARRRVAARRGALDRLRARVVPGRRVPRRAVGGRRGRDADLRVLVEGAHQGGAPGAGARARRSSGSTSTTTTWRGRSTTGWASPRPRSSRWPATWRRSSGRRASGSTSSPPDRSARSPRRASPASRRSRRCGPSGRRSAGTSRDAEPVARAAVALLSDFFPATTGEIVHVDGGFHAVGA